MTQSYNVTAVAIFFGLALVAAAIFLKSDEGVGANIVSPTRTEVAHIYGDPKAPTTIVEFSDYECPFCGRLHPTLKQIVDESDGAINWEYRHLPLPIHPHAQFAAVIGECIAEHSGNKAFWEYGDTIFAGGSRLDNVTLMSLATTHGLSEAQVADCQSNTELLERIETDAATAAAYGGSGTPYSLIVYPDDTVRPVSGALPYNHWQAALNL